MSNLLAEPVTEKEHDGGNVTCVNSRLFYSWAYSSMQGKRKTQEDAHCVTMNFGDQDHHLMMVCDGHGGSLAAKKVREIMEQHLLEQTFDIHGTKKELHKSYANNLFNSFLDVDKKLAEVEEFKTGKDFSGTTVNLAMICEEQIVCANAGDTRCVVSKDQKAIDLSQDHKPSHSEERERIIRAGGHVTNGRVNGLHGVARSLGDFGYKEGCLDDVNKQLVTCKPDVLVYPSEISEDEFVLICCDGVWDVLTSQEAVTFIHECLIVKKIPDLQTCLDMLLDHCLDKGSNDNMTAAIIALPGFCRVHNYFKKPSSACNIS